MDKITHCISTHNNLNYLKLAVKSVRENEYFKDSDFIIHAEGCTDGTNLWLSENASKYNFEYYIEMNEAPVGIGGGMNFCADKAKTELLNYVHSDFYVSKNWDYELYKILEREGEKTWAFSQRIQPNIFNEPSRYGTTIVPKDLFGEYHNNFNEQYFLEWAEEFKRLNDFEIPLCEGVSGMLRKKDYQYLGGNDPLFAPASYEDSDIFLRTLLEGYKFVLTSKSLVMHFGARGSHFPDDDLTKTSERQIESEKKNYEKWIKKWGKMFDRDKFGCIRKEPFLELGKTGKYIYGK